MSKTVQPVSIETSRIIEVIDAVVQNNTSPVQEAPEMKPTPPNTSSGTVIFSEHQKDSKMGVKTDCQKRARGARICKLYHQHPQLMRTAYSRSQRNNEERRQIWKEIAEQINMEFPNLNQVSVSEAKKLVDYYKGKQIRSRSGTPSPAPEEDEKEKKPFFTTFLKKDIPDSVPLDLEKHMEKGRRHRFEFVTTFTSQCMRVCEEKHPSRSRNPEANLGRSNLFTEITAAANWMFREWEGLEELCVDQVKKTHSNYKRRHPGAPIGPLQRAHFEMVHPLKRRSMSESTTTSESSGSPEAPESLDSLTEPMETSDSDVQNIPHQRDAGELVEPQNPRIQMSQSQNPQQILNLLHVLQNRQNAPVQMPQQLPLIPEQTAKLQEDVTFYRSYYLYNEIIKISTAIAKTDFQ